MSDLSLPWKIVNGMYLTFIQDIENNVVCDASMQHADAIVLAVNAAADKDAEIKRLKKVADDIVNNFENAVYDRNASIEEKEAEIARLRAALEVCRKTLNDSRAELAIRDDITYAIKSAEEALKK